MGFQLKSGNSPQFKSLGSSSSMGGSMPRGNMSYDDSPYKAKWWKKVKTRVKSIFGKKKKATTPDWGSIHKKIQAAARKAKAEKRRKKLVAQQTDTSVGSNAINELRETNPWLPEQG